MSKRKTRRLRIQLDILVDFDRNLDTLPAGGQEDHVALLNAIQPILLALPGAEQVTPSMASQFGLDYRKPKT